MAAYLYSHILLIIVQLQLQWLLADGEYNSRPESHKQYNVQVRLDFWLFCSVCSEALVVIIISLSRKNIQAWKANLCVTLVYHTSGNQGPLFASGSGGESLSNGNSQGARGGQTPNFSSQAQ